MLVLRYPRIGWEAHPHFTELTRFWLERHLGFRQMQRMLVDDTRAFLDRSREPRAYARGLSRVGNRLLDELHGHHHIEDDHYFPLLQTFDPRIAAGFDLLEADHQALGAAMQALARAANTVLRAIDEGAAADVATREGSTRPSPASVGSSTGTSSTRRNWWCR